MLAFDHFVIAVQDLDEASGGLLEEHGLASVPGGRHPGHGTGSRIVPLGRDYLELMAIVDPEEARDSPLGSRVTAMTSDGDRPFTLCLRTPALDNLARRLDLVPLAMSRKQPDGSELSWRLVGLDAALSEEPLPFFIEWETPPETHPGHAEAHHRVEPTGIAWVEWGGDAERLADWLGEHRLDIRSVPGSDGPLRAGIAIAGGEIVL